MAEPLRQRIGRLSVTSSWWLLLALVVFVPLFVTTTSLRVSTPDALTFDAVSLPKLCAIMTLGGLALSAHMVAVLLDAAKWRYHWTMVLVAALLAAAGLSTVTSISRPLSLFGEVQSNEGLAAYGAYAIVFVLAVQLTTSTGRFRTIAALATLSGALVSAYALLQSVKLDPLSWPVSDFGSRIFATFGNPDLLAGYLVFVVAMAVGLLLSENRPSPLFWLASTTAALTGVALTITLVRGAWIGAGVVVVVIAFAVWRHGAPVQRATRIAVGATLAFVFGAVLAPILGPLHRLPVAERMASALGGADKVGVAARVAIWRSALDAGFRRPVLGHGPDTFGYAFRLVASPSWWQSSGHGIFAGNAHDILLQTWVTLGAIGTALYSAVLIASLWGVRTRAFGRSANRSSLLLAGTFAAVAGLLATLLTQPTTPMVVVWLWLTMGMLVATQGKPVPAGALAAKGAIAAAAIALIAYALIGVSWLHADTLAQQATRQTDYRSALQLTDRAIAANSLPQAYWRAPGTLLDTELWGEVGAGAPGQQVLALADESVSRYAAAVGHDAQDPLSRTMYVHALNQRQRLSPDTQVADRAVSAGVELARTWPNMPDAVVELARAQLQANLLVDAKANAEQAAVLDPKFEYAWLTLGEVRDAAGDRTGALQALEQAVQLDPTDPDAANLLKQLRGSLAK